MGLNIEAFLPKLYVQLAAVTRSFYIFRVTLQIIHKNSPSTLVLFLLARCTCTNKDPESPTTIQFTAVFTESELFATFIGRRKRDIKF